MYSAAQANGKFFVGYDSKKMEVWDGNTMNNTYTLEMDNSFLKIIPLAVDS